ncbi:MAG TPA: glycosyltransferase family 4 protein [Gemmatimonadaceae bacterium]|nr:MAG: hypothetical protein DMF56_18215 [Acidobacteriota bacterium]HTD84083.1 glycosyltransferase family 4 protein [Gemmatimonadaceae bacterium]
MRILFCSQAAHTGGGVEAWMETLSAALAARGWDVVTALAQGRFHDPSSYGKRHRVIAPVAIDGSSGFREDRILALLALFNRMRPDVIVPVNLADALAAAAYWKARGAATRLVVCVHGQGEDRIDQVRAYAPFIDLAGSVSKRVANRLLDVMGDPARVQHIPTGVPPPLRGTAPREQFRRLAYIGRLDTDKRIDDAVPLVRALPEIDRIHFVGSGPAEADLRNALSNSNVVFHGDIPRERLYETIYPEIDGLLLFSEAETGPIVAWEAMIHGVVPVTSDYVGRREENVIRHAETGLVFPVGDMQRAVELIRSKASPGLLREISIHAQKELPAAYTQTAFEASWDEALHTAIAMPERRDVKAILPSLVSPGAIARLGLGMRATSRIRHLLGRSFRHAEPGSEWPH